MQQEPTPLQQRNAAFRAFLETLNPEQRRAVELTEGPVLVIAGPGAGKTQLLTARIGKILLDTDARAHNVLCLTFTDAGVHAMRQRLLERIGPEAWRVPIFTFHAFCNRVIQDNLEHFGKKQLEPVSELERIDLIRRLLTKLEPEHPLREGRKDVYAYEGHLQDLFANMKKQDWTPGHVRRCADEFLQKMPGDPAFTYQRKTKTHQKGALKTELMADWQVKMERLKAAADLYPKYLNAMERAGRYEYEDMVLWVTRAFEKDKALLQTYQERFQYVLVDEFQDTNGAQFHLLNLLLQYWDLPNIFIVGDDDQSIYEFQGARLENLRRFYERYRSGLETVVLHVNYRSDQRILDSAGKLIAQNELRAVRSLDQAIDKDLKAARGLMPRALAQVQVYENRLQETAGVFTKIQDLLAAGTPPDDIAVLYARHKQAARLQGLLEKQRIPYQSKRPVNILDLPLMRQFRDLLMYLREEATAPFSGEHRLFRLLHAAFFSLNSLDLAKIAWVLRTGKNAGTREELYEKIGRKRQERRFWREALSDASWLESLELAQPESLIRIGQKINQWISDLNNLSLSALLERLYVETGLMSLALQQQDKVFFVQILSSFQQFVTEEANRNPRISLNRLLDLMESMDDNNIALPLQQSLRDGPGIQLLTAHAAKGLEFEHVFMLDCSEDSWEKQHGGNRNRFALPPNLTLSGEEDFMEARRRLFYVAMTRAKRCLYISYAEQDDQGKKLTQTRFVAEGGLPQIRQTVPLEQVMALQVIQTLEAEQPVIRLPEKALIDGLLADFRMSITALNRFLRCPLAFYYEDLLKAPGFMSEAAAYGVAIHGALQQFLLRMKNDKKQQWPSAENLQRLFTQEMEAQRIYFSEQGFAQRLALGRENLRRIHVEQAPYWRRRAVAERRVDRVEFEGIPLTGVLDKIEWLDNGSLRVVDYKTGVPDLKKTAAPDEKQPLGGEYWRQLAFYCVLMERAQLYPEPVSKTAISWLDPDKRGAYPVVELSFNGEQLQFVEGLLRDSWSKIQSRQFNRGCGKEDCVWCKMEKGRQLDGLGREEESGLDDA